LSLVKVGWSNAKLQIIIPTKSPKAESVQLAADDPVLEPVTASARVPGGDKTAGFAVYKKKCRVCHSNLKGKKKVGPSLYGVVGRTPGTLAGYRYSTAMKAFGASGHIWNAQTLDKYLSGPRQYIPKVKMIFKGLPSEQDRANIIAYLDSLDD